MKLHPRLKNYAQLMRLDKPIGFLLLLWPTLSALCLANKGQIPYRLLLIFVFGTFLMRSVGCVLNDIIDMDIDRHVVRTKNRPLSRGDLGVKEAFLLAIFLCCLAALLLTQLNRLSFFLALIALFLSASYPFTKRFLHLPQAYLGLTFSFGIPMAFAASQNRIPLAAVLLFAANFFWIIAYDTEYAMVDKADDLKIGIKTSAISFADYDVLAVMLCHSIFVFFLLCLGWYSLRSWVFYLAILFCVLLIARQYFDIRQRSPEKCFNAFLQNNFIGMLMFVGISMS